MTLNKNTAAIVAAARRCPDTFAEFMGYRPSRVHTDMQRFLSDHGDAAIGMPRGHGKSVQLGLREAWEIGRNPNIRIKHIAQIEDKASEQVRFVISLMHDKRYQLIFPNIELLSEAASGILVKRSKPGRDLTMQACGIFGRAGGRADLIVGDDVCDLKNTILTPAERPKVKDAWYNNWLPMRAFADGNPRTWRAFTPYHNDDLTAEWKKMAEDDGNLFWRPCRGDESPWPEVWTPERLQAQRTEMGGLAYSRAYELIPIDTDTLIFRPEWLERSYYSDSHDQVPGGGRIIAAIDWAFSASSGEKGDYSVCLIAMCAPDGHVYALECLHVQATFPEFVRRVLAACQRYGVRQIIAEGNGPQAGLCQQLSTMTSIPVLRLNRTRDKVTRAIEIQGAVEQGKFHLKCHADGRLVSEMQRIRDEMVGFPASEHDDLVDAVIDIVEHAGTYRYDPQHVPKAVSNNRPKLWRIYGKT